MLQTIPHNDNPHNSNLKPPRKYIEPPLRHGQKWGEWVFDAERLCLVQRGEPVERGGGETGVSPYIAFLGWYEVDVEAVHDSAELADWIF